MDYIATLTWDYTGATANEHNRLQNAICQIHPWEKVETSAFMAECDTLDPIRKAFEVLARAAHTPGKLSALTFNVQLVEPGLQPPAAVNHRQALNNVLAMPLP